MPTLQRSVAGVVQILNSELRRLAMAQGPEGMYMLEHADITADYVKGRSVLRVAFSHRGNEQWVRLLPISRDQVEYSSVMSDADFEETITMTMRAHLNLVAQMHHTRLEAMFPKSIAKVTMGYDVEAQTKTIHVQFKNGHAAEGPEHEAKSEFFLARCTMLYDLPPI